MSEFNHLKNGELSRLLSEAIYTYGTRHQFTQRILIEQSWREKVKVRDYLNALATSGKELDGQGAPEEGYVGRLEHKRKLAIVKRI